MHLLMIVSEVDIHLNKMVEQSQKDVQDCQDLSFQIIKTIVTKWAETHSTKPKVTLCYEMQEENKPETLTYYFNIGEAK